MTTDVLSDPDTVLVEQARDLADSLRQVADFIETRPHLADAMSYTVRRLDAYPLKPDAWQRCLDELGAFRKRSDDVQLHAVRDGFGLSRIEVTIGHEDVCERVQVGERIQQVAVYPEDVTPTVVEQTVPIYEWRCPPSWKNPEPAS